MGEYVVVYWKAIKYLYPPICIEGSEIFIEWMNGADNKVMEVVFSLINF